MLDHDDIQRRGAPNVLLNRSMSFPLPVPAARLGLIFLNLFGGNYKEFIHLGPQLLIVDIDAFGVEITTHLAENILVTGFLEIG